MHGGCGLAGLPVEIPLCGRRGFRFPMSSPHLFEPGSCFGFRNDGQYLHCIFRDVMKHPGIAVPNVVLTNIAKHHFASNYPRMVQNLQDVAGGLLVTAPLRKDWENEATS